MFSWLESWGYEAQGGRDLRIDWLRGFCLFAMTIDHIGGESFLYVFSGRLNFYISAAEGFYFISGLTLGLLASRQTLLQTLERTFSRTLVLYRTAVLIALGFMALSLLGLKVWYDPWDRKQNLVEFVAGVLTLQNGYNGSEILGLYVLYMLFAPLAFWLMYRGRTWVVLLAAGVVYGLSQAYPQVVGAPIASVFKAAAWQILFFGGMVLGFHRQALARFWAARPRWRDALGAGVLLLAGLMLVGHVRGWFPSVDQAVLGPAHTEALVWPRLLLVALYLQAFYLLVTWFWRPLACGLGWFLLPLGSASLWAFTWHLLVMVPLYNLTDYWALTQNPWMGTLLQTLALGVIWGSILLYRRWRARVL
ncbi:OpgC domain-containing protein [Meiothermus sp. QL-1]|uniref:OpgC domain-containing protein n=1 Tax=Meiothermus sp. QL-1 TaxID=2058095 RepID=UPI001314899C|nr:OpgC domain-containing protein [Meiothermus sp. QL-1]